MNTLTSLKKRIKWQNVTITVLLTIMTIHVFIPATILGIKSAPRHIADYCYTINNDLCGDIFETINQYTN